MPLAISSSDNLFFCPQSFPVSGTFPMSQLFASDDQNTRVSAPAPVLPTSIQSWFPLRLTSLISLLSKGLSRVFSDNTVRRHSGFMVQLSQLFVTTGKTTALTICTFVGRVMSLLFNTLSRFVISFPAKKQMSSDFMAAVTIRSDFGAQEEKICHYLHLFPFYLPWSNGARCHDLSFLIFSLKLALSHCSFTLIKRLFTSSSLSAIRVVSSAYLRFLMLLLLILILACNSSSLAFLMMCLD